MKTRHKSSKSILLFACVIAGVFLIKNIVYATSGPILTSFYSLVETVNTTYHSQDVIAIFTTGKAINLSPEQGKGYTGICSLESDNHSEIGNVIQIGMDGQNYKYSCTVNLLRGSEIGRWHFVLNLEDNSGNETYYNADDSDNGNEITQAVPGATGTIIMNNATWEDVDAPALTAFSATPKTVNTTTHSQTVVATFSVSDATGLDVSMSWCELDAQNEWSDEYENYFSGTLQSRGGNSYACTVVMDGGQSMGGNWDWYLDLSDGLGNSVSYGNDGNGNVDIKEVVPGATGTVIKNESALGLYTISTSKSSYNNEENIVFNWSPSIPNYDAKQYKITVYRKFASLADLFDPLPKWYFNFSGTSKNIGKLSVGKYRAQIEPYSVFENDVLSNSVEFTVERIPVPGPVSNMHLTKREYGVDENVIIKWSGAKNAAEYQVNIFNLLDPMIAEKTGVTQDLKFETRLPKGDYTVTVQARNSSGYGPRGSSKLFEITDRNDPVFPVRGVNSDGSLNGWFALTYWHHDQYGGFQRGAIDINRNYNGNTDADKGVDVYAVQDGEVIWKSDAHLIIKHTIPLVLTDGTKIDEWYSQYGHMSNHIARFDKDGKNTKVKKDITVIGKISSVGGNNNHLHFFISKIPGFMEDKCDKVFDERCFKQAISPYWVPGVYSANKSLYADDIYGNREVYPWEDPDLYNKVIFLNPPSYPSDVDKGQYGY